MDAILAIAKKHNLIVIEDACQAHGAEYKGRRAGSMGDMGAFSFYPGKNLGAYGEGGLVSTSNAEYNRTIRMLRDWGAEKKYQHVLKGYNYRMEGIQGAVLSVKLKYLEGWTEARRAAAAHYARFFAGSNVQTPEALRAQPARLSHLRHSHGRTRRVDGSAAEAGNRERHPLSDPGAPAARVRRPRLQGRPVPALGSVPRRNDVAADVPRTHRGAMPDGGIGGEGAR